MRLVLVAERISPPFDEGLKKSVHNLVVHLQEESELLSVTGNSAETVAAGVESANLNVLLLNRHLVASVRRHQPDVILYFPASSDTFNSFVRARLLKSYYPQARTAVFGLQHREYGFLLSVFLPFVRPDLVLTLNPEHERYLQTKHFRTKLVTLGVDTDQFHEVEHDLKSRLRLKYGLPPAKTVVVHVGHIKRNRNLQWLIDLQKGASVQVLVVGSTSTTVDMQIREDLLRSGVMVLTGYLPSIQEIYQLSDIYVFPVVEEDGAIDVPLSVMEALACNLYVITTRFGALPHHFQEGSGFRYFDTKNELIKLVSQADTSHIRNDVIARRFTWRDCARRIADACRELMQ